MTHNIFKKPVKSLAEFLRYVERIKEKWEDEADEEFNPWFRGHADTNYTLKPGFYREEFPSDLEDSYRHDFKLKAYPYLAYTAYQPENEWEWYFVMQHYGLPTRLLDWTEGALFALYFALRDAVGKNHAAVWVLDPWKLNQKVSRCSVPKCRGLGKS